MNRFIHNDLSCDRGSTPGLHFQRPPLTAKDYVRSGFKIQIAFESKAQADEKAQHTGEYVSILKRSATQLSDAR
jgi:hypothetical protein